MYYPTLDSDMSSTLPEIYYPLKSLSGKLINESESITENMIRARGVSCKGCKNLNSSIVCQGQTVNKNGILSMWVFWTKEEIRYPYINYNDENNVTYIVPSIYNMFDNFWYVNWTATSMCINFYIQSISKTLGFLKS